MPDDVNIKDFQDFHRTTSLRNISTIFEEEGSGKGLNQADAASQSQDLSRSCCNSSHSLSRYSEWSSSHGMHPCVIVYLQTDLQTRPIAAEAQLHDRPIQLKPRPPPSGQESALQRWPRLPYHNEHVRSKGKAAADDGDDDDGDDDNDDDDDDDVPQRMRSFLSSRNIDAQREKVR